MRAMRTLVTRQSAAVMYLNTAIAVIAVIDQVFLVRCGESLCLYELCWSTFFTNPRIKGSKSHSWKLECIDWKNEKMLQVQSPKFRGLQRRLGCARSERANLPVQPSIQLMPRQNVDCFNP